ncbi:MAG: LysE family transporter [Verrucomicrobiales bacterium]|nr:LysE family transporter [Verrucomicrobiales bacterium]
MSGTHPVLLAAIAGFVCALIFASIPVGPINLTILNEGAQRGFRWALLIGLGASVMDAIYCAISFTGLSSFFDHGIVKATMQVCSFVFLLFLGFKFLLAQTVKVPTKLDAATELIETRLEQKLHPHSAFMTGFVRVLGNLGVLLTWIILSANLMAHDWVDDLRKAKVACVSGVFAGTVVWFLILSFGVSRGHGKFSEKTLLRFQHISGICLIIAGLFDGANIVWHLAKHKL